MRASCLDARDPDAADEVRPVKVLDGLGRVHGAVAMAQLQRDLHALGVMPARLREAHPPHAPATLKCVRALVGAFTPSLSRAGGNRGPHRAMLCPSRR